MKKEDTLKGLNLDELKLKLQEEQLAYDTLRMGHKVSPIENPIQLRAKRRNIAKIATLISQQKN